MGWFDTQLSERRRNDITGMTESCRDLASVINKRDTSANRKYEDALYEICGYFGIDGGRVPSGVTDINDRMDYIFRPSGVMRRRVTLAGKWWKDLDGVLLCELKEGGMAALIPDRAGRYSFYDHQKGVKYRLGKKTAALLEREAVCFYEPLPQRPLTPKDIYFFLLSGINTGDILFYVLSVVILTLIGMIMPAAVSLLFDVVMPSGDGLFILTVGVMLVGTAVSKFLFTAMKNGYIARMSQKMKNRLRSAVFARVLSLPTDFFRTSGAGDIADRVSIAESLSTVFGDLVFNSGLTVFMSLVYLFQIFTISPVMLPPVLIIFALQIAVGACTAYLAGKNSGEQLRANAQLSGVVVSIFGGIQKIKIAGGESRAFRKWAKVYSKKAGAVYNKPFLLEVSGAVTEAVTVLGMLLIFLFAYGNITMSGYVAFNTCFGMANAALAALIGTLTTGALLGPFMELLQPILSACPETRSDKQAVKNISGSIELSNVSFRYTKDGPMIIDGIDLRIRSGQYVAIVGATGCGKSTLMRLMLGFETPDMGAVYFDRMNLAKTDTNSLRRKLGVVLQNGKLMSDDIFSNIAVSAPGLTMEQAWEAAEIAGVADDIRAMPMGMATMISEGGGGISGGQRQRLLIARAIAHKPSVLMLDEATSALDNLTQKKVSDALAKMKCTRIVIAHRLSTIKECDRIIVLDKGKIVEDGKYDALIKNNGFFAELVARQRIDAGE